MRMEPDSAPYRCPGLGSGAYATHFDRWHSSGIESVGRIYQPAWFRLGSEAAFAGLGN